MRYNKCMNKLYLDMDGVLADFDAYYSKIPAESGDASRFTSAVFDYKIFEQLKPMPDALELLKFVATLDVTVEILTSVNTYDYKQGTEAMLQKRRWLLRNNIEYKANFVCSMEEKSKYACQCCVLVDDSIGCIEPFKKRGGVGILHTNAIDTIKKLETVIGVKNYA